ncbi:MAG: ABC transporter permease, partial [Mariprofundaceae bacterium]|nr:ABC transporter permease [Mariprofundaceae bacterium]
RADRVGLFFLQALQGLQRFSRLFMAILRVFLRMRWVSRPAVMNVVIRQIYFTGVQSLPWIIVIALGTGVLAVYNIVDFARRIQDLSLIGSLMNGVLVQEMAPFLVAIFLLARSGVAVVTEVGHMQSRGEDSLLLSLGVSPHEYLHMPRVIAFSLCGLLLTFVFVVISIWVGGLVVSWTYTLNFSEFLFEVQRGTDLKELIAMMVKGMLYPMLSCIILLDQGSKVGNDPNQIPVRATYGVLGALLLMLFLDVVWVLIWNLL